MMKSDKRKKLVSGFMLMAMITMQSPLLSGVRAGGWWSMPIDSQSISENENIRQRDPMLAGALSETDLETIMGDRLSSSMTTLREQCLKGLQELAEYIKDNDDIEMDNKDRYVSIVFNAIPEEVKLELNLSEETLCDMVSRDEFVQLWDSATEDKPDAYFEDLMKGLNKERIETCLDSADIYIKAGKSVPLNEYLINESVIENRLNRPLPMETLGLYVSIFDYTFSTEILANGAQKILDNIRRAKGYFKTADEFKTLAKELACDDSLLEEYGQRMGKINRKLGIVNRKLDQKQDDLLRLIKLTKIEQKKLENIQNSLNNLLNIKNALLLGKMNNNNNNKEMEAAQQCKEYLEGSKNTLLYLNKRISGIRIEISKMMEIYLSD